MTAETVPLTDEELSRLEHAAISRQARGAESECEECGLEAPLVVRALYQLRELRETAERNGLL